LQLRQRRQWRGLGGASCGCGGVGCRASGSNLGAQLPASGGAAPLTLSCSEGRYYKWGYGGRSTDCDWHLRLPSFVPLISFLVPPPDFLPCPLPDSSFDLDFRSGSIDLDLAMDE